MFDILSNLDQEIIHPGYLEAKKKSCQRTWMVKVPFVAKLSDPIRTHWTFRAVRKKTESRF